MILDSSSSVEEDDLNRGSSACAAAKPRPSLHFLINPSTQHRPMMAWSRSFQANFFFSSPLSTILVSLSSNPLLAVKSVAFSRMLLSPRVYIQILSTLGVISCANKMEGHLQNCQLRSEFKKWDYRYLNAWRIIVSSRFFYSTRSAVWISLESPITSPI